MRTTRQSIKAKIPLSISSSDTQKLAPWAARCQANLTGTEQEMGFL